ncbi:MAG: ABC transporter permease subunit [Bacteroidetes bacterium]|nr:ABC transporter permease subunit [Bacteroidota bacterium]MBS1630032.1 ABC transporter permease subunit [Bacteroidota bacterium]
MKKVMKYVLADILRNRIVLLYTALLLVVSCSVFGLEDNADKGMLSLLNLTLIIVPMMCIIFTTIYQYNSAEFIELLVSQPLRRRHIWLSLFAGLAAALSIAFLVGVGLPVILFQPSLTGLTMVLCGVALSVIFVAIALLASARTRDKARGIGKAILLWLFWSLLWDALVLFFLFQLSDYPLEKPMVLVSFLNPIDLARILILLRMDVSALMGYSGAVFREFFGTGTGILVSALALMAWVAVPLWLSTRAFRKKDL